MQQGSGGLSPYRGQSAAAAASAAAGGVNFAQLRKLYQERCSKLHTQPDKSILALFDKENRYPRASVVWSLSNKHLVRLKISRFESVNTLLGLTCYNRCR